MVEEIFEGKGKMSVRLQPTSAAGGVGKLLQLHPHCLALLQGPEAGPPPDAPCAHSRAPAAAASGGGGSARGGGDGAASGGAPPAPLVPPPAAAAAAAPAAAGEGRQAAAHAQAGPRVASVPRGFLHARARGGAGGVGADARPQVSRGPRVGVAPAAERQSDTRAGGGRGSGEGEYAAQAQYAPVRSSLSCPQLSFVVCPGLFCRARRSLLTRVRTWA